MDATVVPVSLDQRSYDVVVGERLLEQMRDCL